MDKRLSTHRWTYFGLAGVVVVLAVIGFLIYRSLSVESFSVQYSTQDQSQHLMGGEVLMSLEYSKPTDPQERGNRDKDLSRLATTYYHRHGPLGHVLERYNWLAGPINTYWSDVRLPVALVGTLARPAGAFPIEALQQLWSEPPIGVVFLHASSAASYVRPYQRIDFFDHNPDLIALFQPHGPKRSFSMLHDAAERGAVVRIVEGNVLEKLREGPQGFYRVLVVETYRSDRYFLRYLRSHVNEQAFEVFSRAATDDGIICFHTSSRHHPEITDDVIRLAQRQGFAALRGFDGGRHKNRHVGDEARYTSLWVMVSRRAETLRFLTGPPPPWLPQQKGGKGAREGIDFRLEQ